jgi:hypothetical protein
MSFLLSKIFVSTINSSKASLHIMLKNLLILPVLAAFVSETLSSPAPFPNQYTEHALKKRQSLNVVATTNTHANTIDWIPIGSQGKIAQAPPLPPVLPQDPTKKVAKPIAELEMPGVQKGPPGTVPIPRLNATYLANVRQKQAPPKKSGISKRQNSGSHWYVTSNMNVINHGGNWVMVSPLNAIYNFGIRKTILTDIQHLEHV